MENLLRYGKFYAALTGVVSVVISSQVLTGQALEVAVQISSILTALGVFFVPRRDPVPPAVQVSQGVGDGIWDSPEP